MTDLSTVSDNLTAILRSLSDQELDYVVARSKAKSDAEGYRNAGLAKGTFYAWASETRDWLNKLAQDLRRERLVGAELVLVEAAEQAAQVLVDQLKSKKPHIAQGAAKEVLDRTAGKPAQKQQADLSGEVTIRVVYDSDDTNTDG